MSIINAENSYTNVQFCCFVVLENTAIVTQTKRMEIILDNRTKVFLLK